jgi:hypothetical protein
MGLSLAECPDPIRFGYSPDAATDRVCGWLIAMAPPKTADDPNTSDNAGGDLDAVELANRLRHGEIPTVEAPHALAPGDECHFVAPVRFGRRRSDQYGHLMFTSGWLKFCGTLDVSVAWGEVGGVRRAGRDIVVSLEGSRRLLRFSCHSIAEAARGGVIAEHLTSGARPHTVDTQAAYHASV